MKKFGFGKKSDGGGDEDSLKASLFSRSSKNSSPAPAASNPYAQQPQAADPYAQDNSKYANMGSAGPSGPSPYQAARQGLPSGPGAGRGGLPSGPGAGRAGYGGASPAVDRSPAANAGGYGAEKYSTLR